MLRRILGRKAEDPNIGAARDAVQLERFVELGTDMAKPRPVDHVFVLPTDASASRMAAALREREPQAAVTQNGRWVEVAVQMALSPELIADRRALYEALAREHGGKYDGWGAHAD